MLRLYGLIISLFSLKNYQIFIRIFFNLLIFNKLKKFLSRIHVI